MLYLVQLPLPKPTLFPYTTLFRSLPNTLGEALGFWELLNPAYGMGRQTAAYRGHLLTYHGGDLPGFHSQDRKSTRLNSSHGYISYAVFCLKKKIEYSDRNDTTKGN